MNQILQAASTGINYIANLHTAAIAQLLGVKLKELMNINFARIEKK
ncbi:MAG: hypothetical protein LBD59_06745 [Prevotellaceae bacterium]|jgi:hypothetical protein|nr:hypothetical protein [Prevotellaceae bacterium]